MAAEFTDLFGLWKMVFQEAYVPSISMMISGSILNTWHEGSAMDSVNLGLLLGCVDRRIDDPFYVIPTKQPFIHCCTQDFGTTKPGPPCLKCSNRRLSKLRALPTGRPPTPTVTWRAHEPTVTSVTSTRTSPSRSLDARWLRMATGAGHLQLALDLHWCCGRHGPVYGAGWSTGGGVRRRGLVCEER